MFHKTLLSFKDLNKIPKLGKQIKTRQLRSIFHHLLLLSKIVQLFLQNKNKIVHTGHIHHISFLWLLGGGGAGPGGPKRGWFFFFFFVCFFCLFGFFFFFLFFCFFLFF